MTKSGPKVWTVIAGRTVFEAPPYLRVRQETVDLGNGKVIDDYFQVDMPAFAIAVAFDRNGQVITLWQYKHGPRRYGLSFPAGHIESGEDPEKAMRRELLEETGYDAGSFRAIGHYAVSGNQGAGVAHLFIAQDCERTAEANSGDLEEMQLRLLSPSDIDRMIFSEAVSLAHVAVWGAARLVLHSK